MSVTPESVKETTEENTDVTTDGQCDVISVCK